MLRLLFLTAIITLAKSSDLDAFMGKWIAVKCEDCPTGDEVEVCKPFIFEKTDLKVKDVDLETYIVNMVDAGPFEYQNLWFPVTIANNEVELNAALEMYSDKYLGLFKVFQKLSDNYITMNYENPSGKHTILLARNVPTKEELDAFVNMVDNPRIKGEGCIKEN